MDREIDAVFDKMKGMPDPTVSNVRPFIDEVIGILTGTETEYSVTFSFNSVEYRTHYTNVDIAFQFDGYELYTVRMNLHKMAILNDEAGEPMESANVSFSIGFKDFKQVLYGVMSGVVPTFHGMLVSMTGSHVNIRSFIEFAWKQYQGVNMIVIDSLANSKVLSCADLMGSMPFKALRNKIKSKAIMCTVCGPVRNLSARIAIHKEKKLLAKSKDVTQLLEGLSI